MSKEGDESDNRTRRERDNEEGVGLWGILIVGLIGASATTVALKAYQFKKTTDWIYSELSRYRSSWKNRTDFQEEARRRHYRRMQEEYEDEMERLERIRRMQNVFHRERNKHKKSYESWQQNGPTGYHQHSQRNDWYWDADASFKNYSNKYREAPPRPRAAAPLSHHYSILGLDRMRTQPYTDEEIKSAFRTKAKEFHPDQNQDNKEFAEAKFKEVMVSYNAIKSERKNKRPQ